MHHHGAAASVVPTMLVIGAGLVGLLGGYLAALGAAARRGRRWPWWRVACAVGGVASGLAAVVLGPAAHHDFVAHMAGHLLLGMVAPLLLVASAPVTLLLRALPVGAARHVSAVLAGRYLQVVAHPVVAAALDVGGLWLLHATGLHGWMHASSLGHLLVHLHVLLAGWLFTAAILQVDPTPHPSSRRLRAVVLVAFLALHSALGKHVFANPPAGVPRPDAEAGAQLMYYGGDAVDLLLVVGLCWDWYRRTAPRPATGPARHHG